MAIINEVMVGVRETDTACVVEADRAKAIEMAIRAWRGPETLCCWRSKGHEEGADLCRWGGVVR